MKLYSKNKKKYLEYISVLLIICGFSIDIPLLHKVVESCNVALVVELIKLVTVFETVNAIVFGSFVEIEDAVKSAWFSTFALMLRRLKLESEVCSIIGGVTLVCPFWCFITFSVGSNMLIFRLVSSESLLTACFSFFSLVIRDIDIAGLKYICSAKL